MSFRIVKDDASVDWLVELKRPGAFSIVDPVTGEKVGTVTLAMKMRPPEPMPDGFDVEVEKRRLKQGGCCGRGSE